LQTWPHVSSLEGCTTLGLPSSRHGKRKNRYPRTCKRQCQNWMRLKSNRSQARCDGKCRKLRRNCWASAVFIGQDGIIRQSRRGGTCRPRVYTLSGRKQVCQLLAETNFLRALAMRDTNTGNCRYADSGAIHALGE